ncbi:MAG: extracellular solute-binding protein [Pseudomonadota bacterium]
MITRRLLLVAALVALCGIPDRAAAQAAPATKTVTAHGYAVFGDLKYPAGFTHFDWVNPAAPKGGSVRLMADGTFDTLNPYTLKGTSPFNTPGFFKYGISELNETLLVGTGDYAPSGDEPASAYGLLAESIEYPADLSWVLFRLRSEARFHDGKPVTAADVRFSFDILRDQGHPRYRDIYKDVVACEIVDRLAVRFRFRTRHDRMLPLRAGELPVLPKHFWEKRDFTRAFTEPPLLSGPYRVAQVDPGRSLTFERVADYWGRDLAVNRGRWNFDRVRFDFYRDLTVALEAFKADNYDVHLEYISRNWAGAYDVPAVRDGRILRIELPHRIPAGTQAFFFNTRRDIFRDRRVRQALTWLYDFEWANRNLFNGAYTRSESWFPNSPLAAAGLPSAAELELLAPLRAQLPPELFTRPFTLPRTRGDGNLRENLRQATALFAAAGWVTRDGRLVNAATGQPFRFEILISQASSARLVQAWGDVLKRAGIDMQVRMMEPTTYKVRTDSHDYDMAIFVLSQSLTPGQELREYFHSQSRDMPGGRNYAGIADPAADRLVEAALAARSRAGLTTAVHALDRVLLNGYYSIPHWYIRHHRLAYWNRFGRPPVPPPYILGFQDWWSSPQPQGKR